MKFRSGEKALLHMKKTSFCPRLNIAIQHEKIQASYISNRNEMNNTDSFLNPLQTVQFLSYFSSMAKLEFFFENNENTTFEKLTGPILIVNALCDYLDDGNATTIIALGHELLNNSDLYGSRKNETIHPDYVEAMIDHIIATTVFAKFHNTFGFLLYIVNSTNDLTLSSVKQEIVGNLNNHTFSGLNGTILKLSDSTIRRVTERLIFPMFPQPKDEMKIIDVDYIYAQAGVMLARSSRINPQNISFDEYITMSQTIEQGVLGGEIDKDAIKIFQLPALLYFTHKKKQAIQKKKIHQMIQDPQFWEDALNLLFSDLDANYNALRKSEQENPEYQFLKASFTYKNRTELAEITLRELCHLENGSDYATEVAKYKFHNADYYCRAEDKEPLPDINKLFSEQNENIANKFFLFEKAMVTKAFDVNLIKMIDQANVSVYTNVIGRTMVGRYSLSQKLDPNTDLFEIRFPERRIVHYALIRNGSNVKLLSDKDVNLFTKRLGLKLGSRFITPYGSKPLKYRTGSFDDFVSSIAQRRKKIFLEILEHEGYDATFKEKVVKFLWGLIPFHSCKEATETGDMIEIVTLCSLELVFTAPVVGQAAKLFSKLAVASTKPLLLSLGMSMKTFLARETIGSVLKNGIRVLALEAGKEFPKIITKDLFKDIGIAVLRTIDPGIELAFSLTKAGMETIVEFFSMVARKVPSLDKLLQLLRNAKRVLPKKVGTFENHDVLVDSISGNDGYGVKHFWLGEQRVELRTVGSKSEQPVVLINGAKRGKKIFQRFDLIKEEPYGSELILRNDVLIMNPPPLLVRLENIKLKGLSGRGNLPAGRVLNYGINCKNREKAVQILKPFVDEIKAWRTLSQYVLEDKMREPHNFAFQWGHTKSLPEWSKDYKLDDVKLYESLRYHANIEDLNLEEDVAVERLFDSYGIEKIKDVIAVDPRKLFQHYSVNRMHSFLTFEDYYALANFLTTGYTRVSLETYEALRMQSAIYRLALRQVDVVNVPNSVKLYRSEFREFKDVLPFEEGAKITIDSFNILDTDPSLPMENLEQKIEGFKLRVFHELSLDMPYLSVDFHQFFPTNEKKVVLLPGTEFIIERVRTEMMNGKSCLKIYSKNRLISKSKWLAALTNKIKLLKDQETRQLQFDSVVNDFDLDLLQ